MSSRWGRQKHWTREVILTAIREWHDTHMRWPETDDCGGGGPLPHVTTILRGFGTLAEARRQAGMPGGGHEGHGGSGRGGGIPRKTREPLGSAATAARGEARGSSS